MLPELPFTVSIVTPFRVRSFLLSVEAAAAAAAEAATAAEAPVSFEEEAADAAGASRS